MAKHEPTRDTEALARTAYRTYGEAMYQGQPMPAWEDLGDTIRAAWRRAAEAVCLSMQGPAACSQADWEQRA